jgi:hypothetical protein
MSIEEMRAKLKEEHAIWTTQHKKYPELLLFKYDMIEAKFDNPMVCECRGIILNSKNWSVVSRSYDKFFNAGEGLAAPIDWHTARVQEKVDGSLVVLYWYDNAWRVQTSGTPDASGEVSGWKFTFEELFWKVWNELGYRLPSGPSNLCYAFELCTPYNKVIVQHKKNRLVLHGVRSTRGNNYKIDQFAKDYNWECVKSLSLRTLEDIMEMCKLLDPVEQEGCVVVDAYWRRIKIKTPQYVALAHMRDGMGTKRMLELIRSNESSEFLSYFPEWTDLYHFVKDKYEELVNQLQLTYGAIECQQSQKEFALLATKTKLPSILFQKRKTPEKTIRDLLAEANINHLLSVLELRKKVHENLGLQIGSEDS